MKRPNLKEDWAFLFTVLPLYSLPVECNQIRAHRRSAELPDHRGDLSTVICAVINEMLQRLPPSVGEWFALDVRVRKSLLQQFFSE